MNGEGSPTAVAVRYAAWPILGLPLAEGVYMTAFEPLLAQIELTSGNLLALGIVSVLAGILIFVVPKALNYIVAAYLIVVGVLWIIAGV
jgi:uncharacterized membrane protein HdeD (DUF308 family)